MLCVNCGKIPFLCTCKPGVLGAPLSRTPMVGSSAPAPAKKAPKAPPPKRKHNEIGTRPSQDEEEEEDTLALASGSSTSSVLTPPRVPLSPPSTGAVNKKEPPQKKSRLPSPSAVPLMRPTCSRCGSTGLEGVRTSEYDPVMDVWAPPSPQEARRIQALHDTHHAQWLIEQQAARNRWIQEARQNQSTQQ